MSVLVDTTIWSLALRRRPLDLNLAERPGASIFTTDGNFALYARRLPIALHQPRAFDT